MISVQMSPSYLKVQMEDSRANPSDPYDSHFIVVPLVAEGASIGHKLFSASAD